MHGSSPSNLSIAYFRPRAAHTIPVGMSDNPFDYALYDSDEDLPLVKDAVLERSPGVASVHGNLRA